ncbi:hypothetical protein SCA6_018155 [Theobroma cacao]
MKVPQMLMNGAKPEQESDEGKNEFWPPKPHLRLESNKVRLVYIALLKDQRSVSPPTKCYFGSLLLKSVYHYRIGECTYKSVVDFPIGGNDAAGHLSNFPCHQEVP